MSKSANVSLHDGLLRSVERAGDRLEIVFRAGENSTGYFDARLSYEDVDVSGSDEQFLRDAIGRRDVELLYNEFDSAGTHWVHSFLFWPYREASVRFRFALAVSPAPGRFDADEPGPKS